MSCMSDVNGTSPGEGRRSEWSERVRVFRVELAASLAMYLAGPRHGKFTHSATAPRCYFWRAIGWLLVSVTLLGAAALIAAALWFGYYFHFAASLLQLFVVLLIIGLVIIVLSATIASLLEGIPGADVGED